MERAAQAPTEARSPSAPAPGPGTGADAVSAARRLEALRHALGVVIEAALSDPSVVEILANPDGRLVIDRLQGGRADTGVRLSVEDRERAIRLVADHAGTPITPADPRLSGVLPGGERFQGFLPPVATAPAFSIRKRAAVIWRLEDYVRDGALTPDQARQLRTAVADRRNLLISGGAGSGKTTLANALLAEPAFAGDRIFMIEDTPELQCAAWDVVPVLTRRHPVVIGVADLVRDALRMRPDRIVVGEMRDGAAALETLKAWNTGHPGGLATIHANSAVEAIHRLEDLIAEVASRSPQRMIRQAVDLIIQIERTARGRRVTEILMPARSELDAGAPAPG
jgi:type IV secretion system protein TrbB